MRRVAAILFATILVGALTACGPAGPGGATVDPDVRRAYEVTVFTDDPDTGRRVLAAIEALGYTNPDNEVLDSPNDEYNIKWGKAPPEVLEEVRGVVEPMVHQELFPRHLFGPEDYDIFINLPVCKLGGAYRPETCGAGAAVLGTGAPVDPQLDSQGIPQACGFDDGNLTFGSLREGSVVILGRHRPVGGDDNWVDEMEQYVGRSGRVTELVTTDGQGCPVVHVDVDGGEWFWRIRDMRLAGGGDSPAAALPSECGMTEENVQYGDVKVGTSLRLGRHRAWHGDDNWAADMDAFVGQTARVTSLEGVDGAGCGLVKVDIDGGSWYWRVRDAEVVTGGGVQGGIGISAPVTTGFPQQCGLTDESAQYGQAQMGAEVRLGRHRQVDGDANWADGMEPWVGKVGRVTELLGVDAAGCAVVHVDTDKGEWAWRVRDLMAP